MKELLQSKLFWVATAIFALFSIMWVWVLFSPTSGNNSPGLGSEINVVVNYGLLALFGGVCGLIFSKQWGGYRSYTGRALVFLSIGLLAQELGQIIYAYYIYIAKVAVPYPSFGDIGYFGSVILYICGAVSLSKASGVALSLREARHKMVFMAIPIILLLASYTIFLGGYSLQEVSPLRAILDFAYPLGQAAYIAVVILTYVLSRDLMGGFMKDGILMLLLALFSQYIADFIFLYQSKTAVWVSGGFSDCLYLIAYYLMTIALIRMKLIHDQVQEAAAVNTAGAK